MPRYSPNSIFHWAMRHSRSSRAGNPSNRAFEPAQDWSTGLRQRQRDEKTTIEFGDQNRSAIDATPCTALPALRTTSPRRCATRAAR